MLLSEQLLRERDGLLWRGVQAWVREVRWRGGGAGAWDRAGHCDFDDEDDYLPSLYKANNHDHDHEDNDEEDHNYDYDSRAEPNASGRGCKM